MPPKRESAAENAAKDDNLEQKRRIMQDLLKDKQTRDANFPADLGFEMSMKHFPTSGHSLGNVPCMFCAKVEKNLCNHMSQVKSCPSSKFTAKQKEAVRVYTKGYMAFLARGKLDLSLITPATTIKEYERVQEIVGVLKECSFPVIGKYDPPTMRVTRASSEPLLTTQSTIPSRMIEPRSSSAPPITSPNTMQQPATPAQRRPRADQLNDDDAMRSVASSRPPHSPFDFDIEDLSNDSPNTENTTESVDEADFMIQNEDNRDNAPPVDHLQLPWQFDHNRFVSNYVNSLSPEDVTDDSSDNEGSWDEPEHIHILDLLDNHVENDNISRIVVTNRLPLFRKFQPTDAQMDEYTSPDLRATDAIANLQSMYPVDLMDDSVAASIDQRIQMNVNVYESMPLEDPVDVEHQEPNRRETILEVIDKLVRVSHDQPLHKIESTVHQQSNVPRDKLIIRKLDPLYQGGTDVHSLFTDEPNNELLFNFLNDEMVSGAFIVDKGRISSKIRELGLHIRLNPDHHPLLKEFHDFLKPSKLTNLPSNTADQYSSCIGKLMVPVMKAKGRLFTPMSVDDFLFCYQSLGEIVDQMIQMECPPGGINQMLNAIPKFIEFISGKCLNIMWESGLRQTAMGKIEKVKKTAARDVSSWEDEYNRYHKKKAPEPIPYCILSSILNHPLIKQKNEQIKLYFEEHQKVTTEYYFFILGQLLWKILIFNDTRMEATYKLQIRDLELFYHEENIVDGVKKKYWVYTYAPCKRYSSARHNSELFAGFLVFDEDMKDLLEFYRCIRPETDDNKYGTCQLFVTSSGSSSTTAQYGIIRQFLKQINQGHINPGCNQIRKSAAHMEFTESCRKILNAIFDSNQELIANHSKETRWNIYVELKSPIAILAFEELKRLGRIQALLYPAEVLAAINRVQIIDVLSNTPQFVPTTQRKKAPRSQSVIVTRPGISQQNESLNVPVSDNETIRKVDLPEGGTSRKRRLPVVNTNVKRARSKMPLTDQVAMPSVGVTESEMDRGVGDAFEGVDDSDTEPYVYPDNVAGSQELGNLIGRLQSQASEDLSQPVALSQQEEDMVTLHLNIHNVNTCGIFPDFLSLKQVEGILDFLNRCYHQPVQRFPWIYIAEIEGIGRGGFASCDISGNTPITDYLGKLARKTDHNEWLDTADLTEDQKNAICDYRFEFKHKGVDHIFTSHNDVYNGTAGLARYFNHSLHPGCCNVKGRTKLLTIGSFEFLKTIFFTTRDVKKDEQLIWCYGKEYSDERNAAWYNLCPNQNCPLKTKEIVVHRELKPRKLIQVPIDPSVSLSQIGPATEESKEPVFRTLETVAKSFSVLPSQLNMGTLTYNLRTAIEKTSLVKESILVDNWTLELDDSLSTITQLLKSLIKIADSFVVFYLNNSRDRRLKSVRVGSTPSFAIVWINNSRMVAPIIFTEESSGYGLSSKISQTENVYTVVIDKEDVENLDKELPL